MSSTVQGSALIKYLPGILKIHNTLSSLRINVLRFNSFLIFSNHPSLFPLLSEHLLSYSYPGPIIQNCSISEISYYGFCPDHTIRPFISPLSLLSVLMVSSFLTLLSSQLQSPCLTSLSLLPKAYRTP